MREKGRHEPNRSAAYSKPLPGSGGIIDLAVVISSVVHRSISCISRADWDHLLGGEAEGYDYCLTLEKAALSGFAFAYVCIQRSQQIELIAPIFWSDLDLAIGVDRFALKAVSMMRRINRRFLIKRTLFVGSPFGEHGVIGIAPDAIDHADLLKELVSTARRLCREHNLSFIMFKDLLAHDTTGLCALSKMGFTKGESFPNVVVPLPFKNMEEYLGSLSANMRKDLRRKLRQTQSVTSISVEVVDHVEDKLAAVYELYLNTYDAGTVHFEKLTPEYFVQVGRQQKGQAKFFLFYANQRLVCFNLCFLSDGVLIDKFIGLDYTVARKYNLYFYTWFHNVDWCIRSGVRAYQVGQTDYEAKLQLGGKRVPLYFFARHENRLVNALLRIVAPLLTPTD